MYEYIWHITLFEPLIKIHLTPNYSPPYYSWGMQSIVLQLLLQDRFPPPALPTHPHPAVRRCYKSSEEEDHWTWIRGPLPAWHHVAFPSITATYKAHHCVARPVPSTHARHTTQIPLHWHQSSDKRALLINFKSVSYHWAMPKQTCQIMPHLIFMGSFPLKLKAEKKANMKTSTYLHKQTSYDRSPLSSGTRAPLCSYPTGVACVCFWGIVYRKLLSYKPRLERNGSDSSILWKSET